MPSAMDLSALYLRAPLGPVRRPLALIALTLVVALVLAGALAVGPGDLGDLELRSTLLKLRALRAGGAFLAGATLAAAGTAVQALFRNPLADPAVLGVNAGAGFFGSAAMVLATLGGTQLQSALPWFPPEAFLPLGSVAGALAAMAILLWATRGSARLLVVLLLGFVQTSVFLSLGALLTTLAYEQWELGRAVVSLALGSVSGVGMSRLMLALPLAVGGLAAIWAWGPAVDLLLSGEEEAASLGVEVAAARRWVVVWTAFLVAAAVSVGGNIGFVGLLVPHVVRPFSGSATRRLMPAAALAGGGFTALCDLLTRALPTQGELPLGVVTGLIGAPVFGWLLLRAARRGEDGL
jgi:iron complex transport system permease protein